MSKQKILSVTAIAALAVFQGVGCSLIGMGIGAASDPYKLDEAIIRPADFDNLERGSTTEVVKVDSSIVSGVYLGIRSVPAVGHKSGDSQFVPPVPSKRLMPAVEDSILIITNEQGPQKIPVSDIVGFRQHRKSGSGKWVGLAIGATVDATLAIWAISSMIPGW